MCIRRDYVVNLEGIEGEQSGENWIGGCFDRRTTTDRLKDDFGFWSYTRIQKLPDHRPVAPMRSSQSGAGVFEGY